MADSSRCGTRGKAAIYARFSCSKQREASIADQLRVCREWCEREGYLVVATYADEAVSGRTDNRPQFRRMVANAGESDIVLVYAYDRFSRDPYDAPRYKMELARRSVHVVSATEALPDGPEGVLMDKLYEGFAAMESARIARRTRRGMEGNALKCLHNGVVVYGYRFAEDGTYAVDDDQAAFVREVFSRRIAGEPMNHIAADLARRGVRTTYGNPCNYSMVQSMIRNEKYAGVYKWGGVRKEGGMPAIITREVFNMAQTVRTKKARAEEDWGDYPLAGLAYCFECGRNLVGVSGRSGGNKAKYSYYRCAKRCGCKPVRQDWLEGSIVSALRGMLESRERAVMIAGRIAEYMGGDDAAARVAEARKLQADAKRSYDNLVRAVEDGMPYARVADRLAELEQQMERARKDVVLWEATSKVDPESLADFLQGGLTLDDRTLLKAFVNRVYVSTDEVIVALNYSEKKDELARIEFSREFVQNGLGSPIVRLFELPTHVSIGKYQDHILICFPRAGMAA